MAMPKQTLVLFCGVTDGKTVHKWPVAAFTDKDSARLHASLINMAYKQEDRESIKALDPNAAHTPDTLAGVRPKFQIQEVPYNPKPPAAENDDLLFED